MALPAGGFVILPGQSKDDQRWFDFLLVAKEPAKTRTDVGYCTRLLLCSSI